MESTVNSQSVGSLLEFTGVIAQLKEMNVTSWSQTQVLVERNRLATMLLITPRTSRPASDPLQMLITFTEPQYINVICTFGHGPRKALSYQPDQSYAKVVKGPDPVFQEHQEKISALGQVLTAQPMDITALDSNHC